MVAQVEDAFRSKHATIDLKFSQVLVNCLEQRVHWVNVSGLDVPFTVFRNKIVHRDLINIDSILLFHEHKCYQSCDENACTDRSVDHHFVISRCLTCCFLLS